MPPLRHSRLTNFSIETQTQQEVAQGVLRGLLGRTERLLCQEAIQEVRVGLTGDGKSLFAKIFQAYEFLDRDETPSPAKSPGYYEPKYGRPMKPYQWSSSSSSSGGYPSPHPSLLGSPRGSSGSNSPAASAARSPARSGTGSPARGSSQRSPSPPASPRRGCKRDSTGLCGPTGPPRTTSQAGGRSAKLPVLGGTADGGRAGGSRSRGKLFVYSQLSLNPLPFESGLGGSRSRNPSVWVPGHRPVQPQPCFESPLDPRNIVFLNYEFYLVEFASPLIFASS